MSLDDRIVSRYINDFSNVLDSKSEVLANVEELFMYHYESCEEQIVTIIIPSLEGESLQKIGMEFFNKNGFGDTVTNKGLLLIIAREEKKLRIIVGKGLKKKYPISALRNIVENKLRGLVNIGDYERLLQVWLKVTTNDDERKKGLINIFKRENIGFLVILGIIILYLLVRIYIIISGVITFLCVLYYSDVIGFLTVVSGSIAFLYVLYLYFRDPKGRGRYTHILLWIFVATVISVFFITTLSASFLYQPDKTNKPEWCDISRSGEVVKEEIIDRNDSTNRSYDDTTIEFGLGATTDGHSYGD